MNLSFLSKVKPKKKIKQFIEMISVAHVLPVTEWYRHVKAKQTIVTPVRKRKKKSHGKLEDEPMASEKKIFC